MHAIKMMWYRIFYMFKILTNIDMMPALNFGENTMLFCTFNSEGVKNVNETI